jgi:tRNA threonylcarbamoyladenosine biosynthesis protein TsaE
MPTTYTPKTEQKQIALGVEIAQTLNGGDIVLLHGELGTGKTTLSKGIAKGLGVAEEITSPTFAIMNMYEIKQPQSTIKNLIHVDTYRLEHEDELVDIGIEDYLANPETICIIEWPEKIENLLQNKTVKNITIKHSPTSQIERIITIENL